MRNQKKKIAALPFFSKTFLSVPCLLWAAMAAGSLMLAACESDSANNAAGRGPATAVESPLDRNDASGEVLGPPLGTLNLVTVDIPNKRDEPLVVHSILDSNPKGTPLGPVPAIPVNPPATPTIILDPTTTAPSTAPGVNQGAQRSIPEAVQPAIAVPPIKVIQQQHPDDQCAISFDKEGNANLAITCPSGNGDVVLERTGDNWPATFQVHLNYASDKPYTHIAGFSASEMPDATRKLPLKNVTLHEDKGQVTVNIPAFARSQRILLQWADAPR